MIVRLSIHPVIFLIGEVPLSMVASLEVQARRYFVFPLDSPTQLPSRGLNPLCLSLLDFQADGRCGERVGQGGPVHGSGEGEGEKGEGREGGHGFGEGGWDRRGGRQGLDLEKGRGRGGEGGRAWIWRRGGEEEGREGGPGSGEGEGERRGGREGLDLEKVRGRGGEGGRAWIWRR